MALSTILYNFLLKLALTFACFQIAVSGDPDILSDFLVPPNVPIPVNASFFTYTDTRALANDKPPANFTVTKATMAEFPTLNGQSISYAVLQFPAGTENPPHTHPRSAELLFLLEGSLEVGFVETSNTLFNPATALSAFGSASAGTVSLPNTLFATNIDDVTLAKAFKTDVLGSAGVFCKKEK
ncbi:hypothetical protein K2173_005635 [Erythroxylum novogranatense]|uniref:Cupin type-1 domain-containing protein n=1 Tax=Erythroxylum novogranatense TaxID=1862640 RepID=A0AAV8SR45_9ROSI|nr:hypothetical protein K2173_005635 [Erythroxylum novogranatense]